MVVAIMTLGGRYFPAHAGKGWFFVYFYDNCTILRNVVE